MSAIMIEFKGKMYFVTPNHKVENVYGKRLKQDGVIARNVLKLFEEKYNKNN